MHIFMEYFFSCPLVPAQYHSSIQNTLHRFMQFMPSLNRNYNLKLSLPDQSTFTIVSSDSEFMLWLFTFHLSSRSIVRASPPLPADGLTQVPGYLKLWNSRGCRQRYVQAGYVPVGHRLALAHTILGGWFERGAIQTG